MKLCSVEGCEKARHVKIGYCSKHYAKYLKHGDPLGGRDNKYLPGQSPEKCTIDGCDSKHAHGGLCQAHYLRKRRLGDPNAKYDSEKGKICSLDGCGRKHYCKSFCSKHYQSWFKYGDPIYPEKNSISAWIESHKEYKGDDCLIWPFARLTNGYPVIGVDDGRKRIASRVMCEVAHGMPEDESMQAAHSCGNGHKACVNPNHLRWATVKENCHDKYDHGTHLFGEVAPWSKLTEDQVRFILDKEKSGGSTALAKRFGVSKWAIYSIRQGRAWKHISNEQLQTASN